MLLPSSLTLEEDVVIHAVLPKELACFHAAQCVNSGGVGSGVVLDLNEESLATEGDLLNVVPAFRRGHTRTHTHIT